MRRRDPIRAARLLAVAVFAVLLDTRNRGAPLGPARLLIASVGGYPPSAPLLPGPSNGGAAVLRT